MKLKLIILIFVFSSCNQQTDKNVQQIKPDYKISQNNSPLEIVVIDGCEYLFGNWERATVLTHKGDCKNNIHPEHTRK